jgi:ABC-2 type transport system ATP-binding protein
MESIKVNELTKIYGKQKAVNNISFSINSQEIVGFLGPNGAGKSTTMKILTGYIPPSSGRAFINSLNVEENSLEVRKKIGYLPEHNPLYLDMYIKEFLTFIAKVYKLDNIDKRVNEIIGRTGLLPEKNKKIGQLSKGYRQRVGLAQAIIHNPDVLILDEPTSGLDPNQIVEIRNLIKEIGNEKTVMLSTHIMQEVEALCNRVIIINKGEIVADDKTTELKNKFGSNNILIVTFDDFNDESIEKEFIYTFLAKKETKISFKINSNNVPELKKQVFDFAVKHQLIITEMKEIVNSLEDIFKNLTQSKLK